MSSIVKQSSTKPIRNSHNSARPQGIGEKIRFAGVCGARTMYVALFDTTPLRELNKFHGSDIFIMEGFMRRKQYRWFEKLFSEHDITCVGETGFNGGHSAFAFANFGAKCVTSFDLGEHPYVGGAHKYLKKRFPKTVFSLILGDSMDTVPAHRPDNKFDMVFIDGGHSLKVATSDIAKLQKHSKPGGLVIIDDYTVKYPSRLGPKIAYDEAVKRGVITPLAVVSGELRTWAFGRYNP